MTHHLLRDQGIAKKWRTFRTPFGFDVTVSGEHADPTLESAEMQLVLEGTYLSAPAGSVSPDCTGTRGRPRTAKFRAKHSV